MANVPLQGRIARDRGVRAEPGVPGPTGPQLRVRAVRQLRLSFWTISHMHAALYRAAHAARCALLGAHGYRMLIEACNPILDGVITSICHCAVPVIADRCLQSGWCVRHTSTGTSWTGTPLIRTSRATSSAVRLQDLNLASRSSPASTKSPARVRMVWSTSRCPTCRADWW